MSIIVRTILSVIGMIINTSAIAYCNNLDSYTKSNLIHMNTKLILMNVTDTMALMSEKSNSYDNIEIEKNLACEDNVESRINNLYSEIEELQCKIDNIELDINRSLDLKINDLLGFREMLETSLENDSSFCNFIKSNIKLYQNSKNIKKVQREIEENNNIVSELNEEIDSINQEILQLIKYKSTDKISDDTIKTTDINIEQL